MLFELILGFYLGVFISLLILVGVVCLLKYCEYLDTAKELERTLELTIEIFIAIMSIVLFVILFI